MREEDSNWFARWEEELPSPEELIPLSQTLISPDLALAFDIQSPGNGNGNGNGNNLSQQPFTPPSNNNNNNSSSSNPVGPSDLAGENSADLGSGGAGCDEPARTLKRPRLVWTPQLHKRFVDAVAHLGIKNAVPKTIMQLMSVDGLTRENVASHLQKYRLYLKRIQGFSGGGAAGVVNGAGGVNADPATDHLFASSPVPPHFLHPGGARGNSDHFLPYVPVAAIHQQQMAAAAAASVGNSHLQSHQYHRQMGHFGSPTNGQLEHHLFTRQTQQPQVHRMGAPVHSMVPSSYVEDLESANRGRKVLTLFPTGDN